ncbi:MAG: hypothetical protein K5668_00625 [Lachnospiraceae bacterium]|nr:hypothetical protein [Lachnospiraceae bacterium]
MRNMNSVVKGRYTGREYYRGIAAADEDSEDINTAMIWEIKGKEDENRDTGSEILVFTAPDESAGNEILTAYKDRLEEDEVLNSSFEFSELLHAERTSLENDGFELREGESRDNNQAVQGGTDGERPPRQVRTAGGSAFSAEILVSSGDLILYHHRR